MDKWDQRFLDLAKHVSEWSKDPSTKVGAVIVDTDRRIVSVGYNGFPQGVADHDFRLEDRDIKYKMIVHAEANALLFARKDDMYDCVLYTYPFMPCARCAGLIIQTGIWKVVAPKNDNPRWQEDFQYTRDMFREAKVELEEV